MESFRRYRYRVDSKSRKPGPGEGERQEDERQKKQVNLVALKLHVPSEQNRFVRMANTAKIIRTTPMAVTTWDNADRSARSLDRHRYLGGGDTTTQLHEKQFDTLSAKATKP